MKTFQANSNWLRIGKGKKVKFRQGQNDVVIFLQALDQAHVCLQKALWDRGGERGVWESTDQRIATTQMQKYAGLNSSSEVAFLEKRLNFFQQRELVPGHLSQK